MTLQGCLEICWNCFIMQFINAFQLIISIRRVGTYILNVNIYIFIYLFIKGLLFISHIHLWHRNIIRL